VDDRLQHLRKKVSDGTPSKEPYYKIFHDFKAFRHRVVTELRSRGMSFKEIGAIIGRSGGRAASLHREAERASWAVQARKKRAAEVKAAHQDGSKMHLQIRDALCLSTRASKGLWYAKVETLGDLCALTPKELLSQRNFGRSSLREVREALSELGLMLKGDESWVEDHEEYLKD
jgi:transposase